MLRILVAELPVDRDRVGVPDSYEYEVYRSLVGQRRQKRKTQLYI